MSNLETEVLQLRNDMETGFAKVGEEFKEVRQEIAELRQDVVEIRQDVVEIRRDIVEIRRDIVVIRKEIKESHEETRRHFDIVLEGIRSDFKLFIEMYRSEREERQSLDTRVGRLEEGQIHLGNRVTVLERKKR